MRRGEGRESANAGRAYGRERRTDRLENHLNHLDRARVLVLERDRDEGLKEGEVACEKEEEEIKGVSEEGGREEQAKDAPHGSSWMN